MKLQINRHNQNVDKYASLSNTSVKKQIDETKMAQCKILKLGNGYIEVQYYSL